MKWQKEKRIYPPYLSSFSRSQRTIPPLPLSLPPSWLRWGLILRPRLRPPWPLRQWFRDHMVRRSPTQACSSSSSSSSTLHPWTLQCPRPVWRVHLERLLEMSYRYSPYILLFKRQTFLTDSLLWQWSCRNESRKNLPAWRKHHLRSLNVSLLNMRREIFCLTPAASAVHPDWEDHEEAHPRWAPGPEDSIWGAHSEVLGCGYRPCESSFTFCLLSEVNKRSGHF